MSLQTAPPAPVTQGIKGHLRYFNTDIYLCQYFSEGYFFGGAQAPTTGSEAKIGKIY